MPEALIPSVGTVGDALDNALCETTIGLYNTGCVREGSPFRGGPIDGLSDLENITSAWVSWYTASRLMHRLGHRPPAGAEDEYYAHSSPESTPVTRNEVCIKPGTLHGVFRRRDVRCWRAVPDGRRRIGEKPFLSYWYSVLLSLSCLA